MSHFNNREIAIGIWLTIFIFYALSKKDVRKSIKGVFIIFFDKKIILSVLLAAIYTVWNVYVLNSINLWNFSLVKDTIFWVCFVGIVMEFRFITSNADQSLFKNTIIDNLKIIIVLEFIVNTYTFLGLYHF